MSGAALQALYDLGYAQAAAVVGTPYAQYRANGPNSPVTSANKIAAPNAWLTTDAALKGAAQPQAGKPGWYAAIERAGLQVGDILIGQNGTFFVNCVDYPAPVSLTWCNNAAVQIDRLQTGFVAGVAMNYSGDTTQPTDTIMTGWPGWIQIAGSGVSGRPSGMKLPSDARLGIVQMFFPATAPAIQWNDLVTDDAGAQYYIDFAELTPLGWRCSASQVSMPNG